MRFVYLGPGVCLQLPPDASSRLRPCCSARSSCHQGLQRTFTFKSLPGRLSPSGWPAGPARCAPCLSHDRGVSPIVSVSSPSRQCRVQYRPVNLSNFHDLPTHGLWHDTTLIGNRDGVRGQVVEDSGDISGNGRSQVARLYQALYPVQTRRAPREPPSAERRIRWCGGW